MTNETRIQESLRNHAVRISNAHDEGTLIGPSFADCDPNHRVVKLATIQSVVKIYGRVTALYSDLHHQSRQQLTVAANCMYETMQDLIFDQTRGSRQPGVIVW